MASKIVVETNAMMTVQIKRGEVISARFWYPGEEMPDGERAAGWKAPNGTMRRLVDVLTFIRTPSVRVVSARIIFKLVLGLSHNIVGSQQSLRAEVTKACDSCFAGETKTCERFIAIPVTRRFFDEQKWAYGAEMPADVIEAREYLAIGGVGTKVSTGDTFIKYGLAFTGFLFTPDESSQLFLFWSAIRRGRGKIARINHDNILKSGIGELITMQEYKEIVDTADNLKELEAAKPKELTTDDDGE